jgi:hypothetical protein
MGFDLLQLGTGHMLMSRQSAGCVRLLRLHRRRRLLRRTGCSNCDWIVLVRLQFVHSFFQPINALEQFFHRWLVRRRGRWLLRESQVRQ